MKTEKQVRTWRIYRYPETDLIAVSHEDYLALQAQADKLAEALEKYQKLQWSKEYYYKEKDEYLFYVVANDEIQAIAKQALQEYNKFK